MHVNASQKKTSQSSQLREVPPYQQRQPHIDAGAQARHIQHVIRKQEGQMTDDVYVRDDRRIGLRGVYAHGAWVWSRRATACMMPCKVY